MFKNRLLANYHKCHNLTIIQAFVTIKLKAYMQTLNHFIVFLNYDIEISKKVIECPQFHNSRVENSNMY